MPFFRIPEDQQNSIVALLDHKDRRALAISCHDGRRIINGQYDHEENTFREKVRLLSSHALRICKSPKEAQLCYRQTLTEVCRFLKISSNFVRPAYKQLINDFFSTFKTIKKQELPQIHYPRQEFYHSIQPLLPRAAPLVNVDLESLAQEFDFTRLDLEDDAEEQLLKGLKEGSIDCETTQYGTNLIFYAMEQGNKKLFDLLLSLGANIECQLDYFRNATPLFFALHYFHGSRTEEDREIRKYFLIKILEQGANTEDFTVIMKIKEYLRSVEDFQEEPNNVENQENDFPPTLSEGEQLVPVNYKTLLNDLKEIYAKYFAKTNPKQKISG